MFLTFPHKLSLDIFKPDAYAKPEVPLVLLFHSSSQDVGLMCHAGAGRAGHPQPVHRKRREGHILQNPAAEKNFWENSALAQATACLALTSVSAPTLWKAVSGSGVGISPANLSVLC